MEYWEVNEAFSVVDLANRQLLGLHPDRWVKGGVQNGCGEERGVLCEGVCMTAVTRTHMGAGTAERL